MVPECSVCGLAVDWLRSCYQSSWHLFADSPSTLTVGRYYFCPPSTPFAGISTNLSSRNWLDRNFLNEQALGEDLAAKQVWDNGLPPAALPRNQIIGSKDCISSGEQIVNALPESQIIDGFNSLCFRPRVPLDPVWDAASSYNSCSLQYFYARAIEWVYDGDLASLTTAFRLLLGPATVVTLYPGNASLPEMCVAKTSTCSVIVIDGTTTFQQIALQAFMGINLPVNFGLIDTQPLWYAASSQAVSNLNAAGIDTTKPIMIAGHSYGGAAATVLYARLLLSGNQGPFRMITFGNPKPGGQLLRTVLEGGTAIHLANDDDLVTALGPDLLELAPVQITLPLPVLSNWTHWKRPLNQVRQDINGVLSPNVGVLLDYATLLALATNAIAHIQPNPITGHTIPEYARRIRVRCPNPEYPVSPALWAFLTAQSDMLLEDLTNMLLEDSSHMLLEI